MCGRSPASRLHAAVIPDVAQQRARLLRLGPVGELATSANGEPSSPRCMATSRLSSTRHPVEQLRRLERARDARRARREKPACRPARRRPAARSRSAGL